MAKRSHVVTIDVGDAMWGGMDVVTETQGLGKSDLLRTGIWRMHDWARDDERGFVTGLQGHVEKGGTKYMLWISAETKEALQTCIDISERQGVDTTQRRLLSFIWQETVAKGVYKPAIVGASNTQKATRPTLEHPTDNGMRITQSLCVGDDIRTAIPSFSTLRAGARVFVDRKSLGVIVAVEKVRDSESLLIERGAFGYALLVWKDVPCVLMRFTNEARDGVEYRCTLNANNTAGWERMEGGVSEDPIGGDVSDEDEGGEQTEGAPFRRVMVYAITTRGIVSVIRSVSFHRHHVERVFTALNRHSGRYKDGERIREVEVALQEMSVDELIQKGGYYPMM